MMMMKKILQLIMIREKEKVKGSGSVLVADSF